MKNFLFRMVILPFLSSLMVGCFDGGTLIEVSIPVKEPRLVIYSDIFPGGELIRTSPLGIIVTSTGPLFEMNADLITDAEVLVYKNGGFFGALEYVDTLGYYPLYDHPDYRDEYRIEVSKEGFPRAEAVAVVPTAVEIDTVLITPYSYFDEDDYLFSEVDIRFHDAADETNYYEVVVFMTSGFFEDSTDFDPDDFQENAGEAFELVAYDKVITEEPYYTSKTSINCDYPTSLLFRDNLFNGEEYSLKVYFNPAGRYHIPGHVASQRLRVYLRKVTEARFLFKTSMIQQYIQSQEDILYGVGEPVNVFSNIENGYGLFGAYSYDNFFLSIDGFIAKEK